MRRSAALLLAASLASAARADTSAGAPAPELRAFFPGAKNARFLIRLRGQFSTAARYDVNLANAPPVGRQPEPPPIDVPHLAAMNADLRRAVDDTMRGLGLASEFNDSSAFGRRLTVEPDGDVLFELTLQIGGPSGFGGHYAGTELVASVKSLHREEEMPLVFTIAQVPPLADEAQQLRAVRETMRAAIVSALRKFRATVTTPLLAVELRFVVDGLGEAQRLALVDQVASCAGRKLHAVLLTPRAPNTYVAMLRLVVSEPELLDWAARVLDSLGAGKGQGCLWRTPLDGYRVAIDRQPPRALAISFSRP